MLAFRKGGWKVFSHEVENSEAFEHSQYKYDVAMRSVQCIKIQTGEEFSLLPSTTPFASNANSIHPIFGRKICKMIYVYVVVLILAIRIEVTTVQ